MQLNIAPRKDIIFQPIHSFSNFWSRRIKSLPNCTILLVHTSKNCFWSYYVNHAMAQMKLNWKNLPVSNLRRTVHSLPSLVLISKAFSCFNSWLFFLDVPGGLKFSVGFSLWVERTRWVFWIYFIARACPTHDQKHKLQSSRKYYRKFIKNTRIVKFYVQYFL